MKTYIFDVEVFKDDWLVIAVNADDSSDRIVIHNDTQALRAFVHRPDIMLGGFNVKHYDKFILQTILAGGSNVEVKRCNDFILEGNNGWEYPFIRGAEKIDMFDLRDDIADKGLSLKAIEGNMKKNIIETGVDFDTPQPLTDDELQKENSYCSYDVDATVALKGQRKDYLESKRMIAKMYDIPEKEALGMTNAKLCARVLGATYAERGDERDYEFPDRLDRSLIPDPVYEFFDQIHDMTIPDAKLFGTESTKGLTLDVVYHTGGGDCPATYAWGGLHGAINGLTIESGADRLIICLDVPSMYPHTTINFNYFSRSMEDPKRYVEIVEKRMEDKAAGRKKEADAEKLIINTNYGATLSPFNPLYDPKNGRSVCITGQLSMTELLVMIGQACGTVRFLNLNTDGIIVSINPREEAALTETYEAWCQATGFGMERTDFRKLIQKDVNNYIAVRADGSIKVKGGFVSLYAGGNFKSNSESVIDKAVVEYLAHGVPVEDTINGEDDIFAFQNIEKTGGMYEGTYQESNGGVIKLQKVNRIYAGKRPEDGRIFKRKIITERRHKDKATGKMVSEPVDPPKIQEKTISDCPEHPLVDNLNRYSIKDIDKCYYINKAKERVQKYTEPNSTATRRQQQIKTHIDLTKTQKTEVLEMSEKNVYQKLAQARVDFLATPVKKNGVNNYAGFNFMELPDIVPEATRIFQANGLLFTVSFEVDVGIGDIINVDKPEERIRFTSPMPSLMNVDGKYPNGMNAVQAVGGAETYIRRYLYYLALDIVEHDAFDATSGKPEPKQPAEKEQIPMPECLTQPADQNKIREAVEKLKNLRDSDLNGKFNQFLAESKQALQNNPTEPDVETIIYRTEQYLKEIPLPYNAV